jgi:hypothetical protein
MEQRLRSSCRSSRQAPGLRGRVPGKSGEDVSLNTDLTGLIRAIVNEIAYGDNGANPSDFRGDLSGLTCIPEKPGEDAGVNA